MIFVWSVGIIIILSLASGQGISTFLTTIGAMSAIILLIFKDSILGFVTSIQITINDTVRIGDWITMKSSNGATRRKALILFFFSAFFRLTSKGIPSVVKIFCVSLLINKKGGYLITALNIIYHLGL